MRYVSKIVVAALSVVVGLSCVSCSGPVRPVIPPPPSEVGRYQIHVAGEGSQVIAVFLQDTRDGDTFVFQRGSGPLANGYWTQIPRVSQGTEYWQQVFQQAMQQPTAPAPTNPSPSSAAAK